jgi:hypothetical protein
MPKSKSVCKPCMSPGIKNTIRDYNKSPEVVKVLDGIADCPDGESLRICECSAGREGKVKREPSEYNRFISSCFKDKPDTTLKECAQDWTKQKKTT